MQSINNVHTMDKLILLKIKHLPKAQQYILIKLIKENPEIAEDLKILDSDREVSKFFEKINNDLNRKNKDVFTKLLKDYKKDIKSLKDTQEMILIESKIMGQIIE